MLSFFFIVIHFLNVHSCVLLSHCAVARLQPTGWRLGVSGGFYPLSFKSAFPAAVAPNRSLAAGHLSLV
jgi:hypothetical protein